MSRIDERPPTPFPNYNDDINDRVGKLTTIEEVNESPETSENVTMKSPSKIKNSQLFINTYIKLKSKISDSEINASTVIHILKLSMEIVETLEEVQGEEQRDFAVSLVREIIDKSKLSPIQKENCLIVIDFGVLDHVVDFVIDATKGNLDINKVKKKVFRIFPCCK